MPSLFKAGVRPWLVRPFNNRNFDGIFYLLAIFWGTFGFPQFGCSILKHTYVVRIYKFTYTYSYNRVWFDLRTYVLLNDHTFQRLNTYLFNLFLNLLTMFPVLKVIFTSSIHLLLISTSAISHNGWNFWRALIFYLT